MEGRAGGLREEVPGTLIHAARPPASAVERAL